MPEKIPDLFVFKQSYKSKNLSSTRTLNQKHLIYIATRPGVMCNPECGFGLWGKLPDMKSSQNIDDLRIARRVIGEASENHTLYRAILSVDKSTAQDYDLYDRETWQKLINTRISVVQKEMHIKPENFRWVASMHYKKRHPHVHILYWDAGKEPRNEFILKERFELIAERVRTTFSRALYFEREIKIVQAEQTETEKAARLQLTALLRSANLPDALDLDHVKQSELDDLGKGLVGLAQALPSTGRLKYKLLKTEYKKQLDAWLDQVMQISDFAKLEKKYLKLSAEVTRLYGDDTALAEKFLKKVHNQLYTDLGNETLSFLKEIAQQLRANEPPEDLQALRMVTWRLASQILQNNPAFLELLKGLPKWRTPSSEILKEETVKKQINTLTRELAQDIRIRSKVDGYFEEAKLKQDSAKKPIKEQRKEVYSALYQATRAAILEEIGLKLGEPIHSELGESRPSDGQELYEATRRMAGQLLQESPTFAQLLTVLPNHHQSVGGLLQNEDIKEQMDAVIRELTHDLRLRSEVEHFVAATSEDQAAAKESRRSEYSDLYRSMNDLVMETARQEMGYDVQEQREIAVMGLLRLFSSGSQSKNQLRSQRDLQREKYRNLSDVAKRDLRKKRQQEGSWSMEF